MLPGETILSGARSHEQDSRISQFKVLRSAAGYFIGTQYTHDGTCCTNDGIHLCTDLVEPNSRETGYWRTKEDAEEALALFHKHGVMPGQR